MKLRPQFQLRLRDAAQFERMREGAEAAGLSLNEYILAALEARMAEDAVAIQVGRARQQGWAEGQR